MCLLLFGNDVGPSVEPGPAGQATMRCGNPEVLVSSLDDVGTGDGLQYLSRLALPTLADPGMCLATASFD
jgi:hypothetical protein